MSKQTVVGVFAVLPAAASAACGSNGGEQEATVAPTVTAIETPAAAPEPSIPDGAVMVINRDQSGSGEYRFDPSELTFKVGEEVTFDSLVKTRFEEVPAIQHT